MSIHPTSIIDPSAIIEDGASIGPGVIIGPGSVIKSGADLGPYVVIGPNTTIGENARLYTGVVVGTEPQDFKYDGTPTTCEVGPRTLIREYCTVNRGTKASGATKIGADCMMMSYSHVGHDCRIGNNVVMASGVLFGGHAEAEDKCIIGGSTAIHQFGRIGTLAMVGGMSGIRKDCPPYMITAGPPPAMVYGLNSIGLKRNGIAPKNRQIIKEAYTLLYRSGLNVNDALSRIKTDLEQTDEIVHLLEFFSRSKRGVARGHVGTQEQLDEEMIEQAGPKAQLA